MKSAAKEKLMCGLPETSHKWFCNDDNDSLTMADEESTAYDQQPKQPRLKIPHKVTDMTESFTAGNERITFVPGWQPIPRGSGVFKTIPKSFKEKIWQNEFFSYRELHRAMNKSNATHSLKSIFDKLLEEEEVPTSSSAEKDHIHLLDLNIMQTQFFALYSQMYP